MSEKPIKAKPAFVENNNARISFLPTEKQLKILENLSKKLFGKISYPTTLRYLIEKYSQEEEANVHKK